MGIYALGQKYGGKICILCDLDCQHILPHGSAQDVNNHVREMIQAFGSYGGGLIGGGEVEPNIPLPNVEAMLEAYEKYGKYKG